MESGPIDRPESLMDGASLLLHTGRDNALACGCCAAIFELSRGGRARPSKRTICWASCSKSKATARLPPNNIRAALALFAHLPPRSGRLEAGRTLKPIVARSRGSHLAPFATCGSSLDLDRDPVKGSRSRRGI